MISAFTKKIELLKILRRTGYVLSGLLAATIWFSKSTIPLFHMVISLKIFFGSLSIIAFGFLGFVIFEYTKVHMLIKKEDSIDKKIYTAGAAYMSEEELLNGGYIPRNKCDNKIIP